MTKLQNNKGFTLVELLIVIAIIAILAAVALPVYSAQMDSARETVDNSVVRSAASLAQSDYLLGGYQSDVTYFIVVAEAQTGQDTQNIEVFADKSNPEVSAYTTKNSIDVTNWPTAHDWDPQSSTYKDAVDPAVSASSISLIIGNGGFTVSAGIV